MTLYIGVDFHPHQQTVAWCDSETGETRRFDLVHDLEQVRRFYTTLPEPADRWYRGFGKSGLVREHAL